MRFLSFVLVIYAGAIVHVAVGTMAALTNGKHYAVQDHEAAQKAIDAHQHHNANRHANANQHNNAAAIARAQNANAERDQSFAEKQNAIAEKENREHDLAKDILASEDAGEYRKKRLSMLKKDVKDDSFAWRKAKLIGREREKDRAARDYNKADNHKKNHSKEAKSAAAESRNGDVKGGAATNSAASKKGAAVYDSGSDDKRSAEGPFQAI